MLTRTLYAVVALLLGAYYSSAHATIVLNGTRVVFESSNKEASLSVHNAGNEEVLLQSWLEIEAGSTADVPFAVTPPLARLPGNARQVLRIMYRGDGVAKDKESVFWLNVQEIPKVIEGSNVLQLAVRQRIKLFYRPAGLAGSAKNASAALKWQIASRANLNVLQVHNPSAYHVSIAQLKVSGKNFETEAVSSQMIAPGQTADIPMKTPIGTSSLKLDFTSINDFGGPDNYQTQLEPGRSVTAHSVNH
ncbi:putative fimbrial chaperone YadV [Pseudomonas fluorescens]|uniref:fimbrial biogenesis chaperone n=1 Tax=Pseudomonas fluorescens TaxID=294 RepID=UPI00123F9D09|nr:molecular chaperone [Pseudomonas fluorescens]VVP32905.1 putative fimbrial chaperone YadV [Pseudomonas fluorescens]